MLAKPCCTLLLFALATHALAGVTGFVNGVYVPCANYLNIPHTPAPTMVTTPISWAQYQALLHPVPATPIPWVPTPVPTEPAPLPPPSALQPKSWSGTAAAPGPWTVLTWRPSRPPLPAWVGP